MKGKCRKRWGMRIGMRTVWNSNTTNILHGRPMSILFFILFFRFLSIPLSLFYPVVPITPEIIEWQWHHILVLLAYSANINKTYCFEFNALGASVGDQKWNIRSIVAAIWWHQVHRGWNQKWALTWIECTPYSALYVELTRETTFKGSWHGAYTLHTSLDPEAWVE